MPPGIVGFEALGRHGALGVVVEVEELGEEAPVLVVRGGVSKALVYHVPWARVRAVSRTERHVVLDLDLADFDPFLRDDGIVELRPARR